MTDIKAEIEKTFRESFSSGELFDAFNIAIKNKIDDPELYKVLLSNPTLSKDELILFTEKIRQDLPKLCFDIYTWTAWVFENRNNHYAHILDAINYYQRAAYTMPEKLEPYLKALALYNYEFEQPQNIEIMQLVNTGEEFVNEKKQLYQALAKHFGKKGDLTLERKYRELAAKPGQ